MTYTVMGRCPKTNQLGIAIATNSLGVGGYCLYFDPKVGEVSTQAYANPRLGPIALDLLREGNSPKKVNEKLASYDSYFPYRQVGIVSANGSMDVHTGPKARQWAGHFLGNDSLVMGNVLDSENVATAMLCTFEENCELELSDRLMQSLEAGRDAGGQGDLADRSAALVVYDQENYPLMDLRVDYSQHAIRDLRGVYTEYRPYIPLYYGVRVNDPPNSPPQGVWIQRLRDQGLLS